ncbi:MAG: hypothetical protein JJE09_02590 [Bacteroidia bacterium]|nr:hypothetical protein [Bacteroidia bacterium]
MRGVFFLISFLLYFQIQVMGQVTLAEFIRSSADAPEMKTFSDQLSFLQEKPYRLSPLQKLEFRTQNRELQSNQQEYGIRFTPANPWEVRNNNRYFQQYQTSLSLEKNMILKEVLLQRYKLIISYLYYSDLRSLANLNKKLIGNQLSISERQATSSLFDPEEYVELKVAWLEKSVSLEEVDFDLFNQRANINKAYPSAFKKDIDWSGSALINVDRIKEVIDSLHLVTVASTRVLYQQEKVGLAQSEYNLEKTNVNVGFLQTEYDQRRVTQDRTPINISLGITIPLTNPNKGDMTKSKLDIIEAEHDLESVRQETQLSKEMAHDQLESLISRHQDLQKNILELEDSRLASDLSQMQNGDPLAIIKFEESLNKLKVLHARLRRNILMSYIDYLAVHDHLHQQPLINFLSDRLEIIR